MKNRSSSSWMVILSVVVFLSLITQVLGSCSCCTTINGRQWNLDALTRVGSQKDWIVKLGNINSFWVNFCQQASAPCSTAQNPAAVCQNQSGTIFSAGALSTQKWAVYTGSSGSGISLMYSGGGKCNGSSSPSRQVSINVMCGSDNPGTFLGGSVGSNCAYQLNMKSVFGCAHSVTSTSTSGGTGSTSGTDSTTGGGSSSDSDSGSDCVPGSGSGSELVCDTGFPKGGFFLIAFFVTVALYFGGGSLVRKYAMHKEGQDIVPQVEFWKDFPYLIKDGFVFTFHKIKGRISGEHEPLMG